MDAQTLQTIYKYVVLFLYSYFATRWSIPYVIAKSKKYGYLTYDVYKKDKKKIPLMGGVSILIGILVSLSLSVILLDRLNLGNLFIFYFVVIVYGLYGILDDIFKFKTRYDKILVTLVLTFPIASLIPDTIIHIFSYPMDLGGLYSLIFVPLFVMFVANSINLHAGYNGLTTGLEAILLIAITIKTYLTGGLDNILFILPVLAAVLAIFPFTLYPGRILSGNVGDFLVGSAIGGLLVINNLVWFGAFILIPHIINFLMDTYTILIKRVPDVKFGKAAKDGTIIAPATMKYKSLKFLVVSWFRLTERQAVLVLYSLTAIFCILGLIFF